MSDPKEFTPPCHGLLWAWDSGTAAMLDEAAVEATLRRTPDGGGMWLHFDLVDARARVFLRALSGVPEAAREALVDRVDMPHLNVEGTVIWGVLPDFHHEVSDTPDPAYMGLLHLVLTPSVLVTGRRHPLRAVQIVRGRPRPDAGPAMRWDDILGAMLDGIGKAAAELAARLDVLEDALLRDSRGDRTELAQMRRAILLLHRRVQPLARLYEELAEAPPAWLAAGGHNVTRASRRIDTALRAIEALQDRGRIAQDELAALATDETNRRLLVLSVLTAVLLPPTLVTGFFGMNTTDLPGTEAPGGFWWALAAIVASALLALVLVIRLRLLEEPRRSK